MIMIIIPLVLFTVLLHAYPSDFFLPDDTNSANDLLFSSASDLGFFTQDPVASPSIALSDLDSEINLFEPENELFKGGSFSDSKIRSTI